MRARGISLTLAVGMVLVCTTVPTYAIDNGNELKCQLATSKTLGKFMQLKTKCIDGCYKQVFGGGAVAADCQPPYAGKTSGCITSSEAKSIGDIQSSCNKDCPECYTGGDCMADSDLKIADAESLVETTTAGVYCDDSASGDGLTLSEFKCQRTVAKFAMKFAAAKLKCYAKCRKAEFRGKVAAGACTPPATDPGTQECIARYEEKTAFLIDRKCESAVNPSADKPECAPYDVNDGAAWTAAMEAEVDARHGDVFCNDP